MAKAKTPVAAKQLLGLTNVNVEDLLLDADNPRLASLADSHTDDQRALVKILWDEMAVDELVLSIAANGFFKEEPLFVIPKPDGKYVVVEGNRRLAAVKILLDDSLRARLRIENMPVLTPAQRRNLQTLPVSVYATRKELWAFLSFRHINSAKAWDPYSKAKYIAHVHEDYKVPLDEIADRIGDRHSTVIRLYRGFRVLQQAEDTETFAVADAVRGRFSFSHLYTALNYPEYRNFLGITDRTIDRPNPVPRARMGDLGQLLEWLYGNKAEDIPPVVVRQAPDLNRLRMVLTVPQALNALRRGYSLDKCYSIGVGDTLVFSQALTAAKTELQGAKSTVATGYKGEADALEVASELVELATSLHDEMKSRAKKRRK